MTSFDKPLTACIAKTSIAARETKTPRQMDATRYAKKMAELRTELQGCDYYLAGFEGATQQGMEMNKALRVKVLAKIAKLEASF